MSNQPKIHKKTFPIGRLEMILEGEQFPGSSILDTKVTINGETLCWISWPEKDEFQKKLNDLIHQYSI